MSEKTKAIPRAASAEEAGVSSAECQAFIEDAKRNNLEFHSLMVVRNGRTAVEWYNEPYNSDTPHMMYSFSKAVTSTAIGFAVDEGLLHLDDKVVSFFPDYVPKKTDPRLDRLTIYNLLTMTSGKNPNILDDKGKIDWVDAYLNCPWIFAPGEDYLYVSENIYMLCAILVRASGMSVVDYLMPRLFEPLGIDRPFWETDPAGVEAGGWGLYLKTEDCAKFSLCYLNGGKYNGVQVIPEQWAKDAVSFQVKPNQKSMFPDNRVGYGYCFWHTNTDPMNYRADGLFAQYGIVFPELDAVVITTGGVADEQTARDCVWRHFPKAFKEPFAEPVKIENTKADEPVVSMHPAKEQSINGKRIKVFKNPSLVITGFEPSVLPIAVTYMMTEKGKTIDNVVFQFKEDECLFSWNEGKHHNTVRCGMDGKARYDEMLLAGLHFKTASYAFWKDDSTLELHIRPYETVGKRIFTFRFNDKGVIIKPDGVPSMKDLAYYLGRAAAEVIPYDFLIKAAGKISALIPPLAEPPHFGKFL